jgi:hypothetical protein
MTNATTTKLPMHPILSQNPGERLVADMKMMPNVDEATQARYLLVVVDHFSKFCWVFCLPTKDSQPIADRIHAVIQEVQSHHKVVFVHTDNGREFVNEALSAITESSGATRITGRPYHPQSQGVVERKNRTLYSKLVKLAKTRPSDWAKDVQPVVVNENNQVARTTGVRPHLLLWGHDHASCPGGQHAQLSLEEWDKLKHEVRERMYEKGEKAKKAVEQRRPSTKLKVGDHVLVKTVNRSERRSAKVLEPTFSVRAVVSEVLVGCKFRLNWSEDWARGEIGEESKQIWYLKDLKKIQTKPVFDWDAAAEIDPLKSGEVDEQLGNASPSTTVPPRIGSPKKKSARKRSAGTNSGEEGRPSSRRRVRAKTEKTSQGQQLWDNGVNGCFFNAVLAFFFVMKAWDPEIDQDTQACCPMARNMLGCAPEWDSSQMQKKKPVEWMGELALLNAAKDELRQVCCRRFTAGYGEGSNFGGPHSVWQSLFVDEFSLSTTSVVTGDSPVQLGDPEELIATAAMFGCEGTLHFECRRCGRVKEEHLRDLSMAALLPFAKSSKDSVPLGVAVQNLLSTDEVLAQTCTKRVTVESSIEPGSVTNMERCFGQRIVRYTDVNPGRFFVLWFADVAGRRISDGRMPRWEPTITLTNIKGGDRSYRVIGIISNPNTTRDHFIVKMLEPDGSWWRYDGLANNRCTIKIPDVDQLTTLDVALLFYRTE